MDEWTDYLLDNNVKMCVSCYAGMSEVIVEQK